jgi:hypothetical protein
VNDHKDGEPDHCYDCGREDCPDFLAGIAPSERAVIEELAKLTKVTSVNRTYTASEYSERLRKSEVGWCIEPEDWKALNYLYAVASLCAEGKHDSYPKDVEMIKRAGKIIQTLFGKPNE